MATRLQQIITIGPLDPGAVGSAAHSLNVDGRAVIPDRINRSDPGFAGIAATTTTVTVRNDTDAAASVQLYLRYYHTIDRVYGAKATQALTPDPWWDGGSASTVIADSVIDAFVFQPGGAATGPSVFASFPDLYTALVAARTAAGGNIPILLGYDTSLGAATVPAGTYDFTNVKQVGLGDAQVAVTYADGTVFTGARSWDNLVVTNANTVTAPVTDLATGDQVFLRRTTLQTTTGGAAALVNISAAGTYTVWLNEGSALGSAGATGPALIGSGAAVKTIRLVLDSTSTITVPTAVTTGGGATMIEQIPSMTKALQVSGTLALDSTTPFVLDTPASFAPTPPLTTSGAPVTAAFGSWCKVSSGVAQPLPAISTATARGPGVPVVVTNVSSLGSAPVTVTPAAGDTIMGGGGAYTIPGNTTAVFISDGVSNWYVMVDAPSAIPVPQVLRSSKYGGDDGAVAVDNDVALAVFLGYAYRDLAIGTNLRVSWRNVGAAVDVTWAEVALGVSSVGYFAGSTPVGLVTVGATSIAVPVVSATTNFTSTVTLTVEVPKGAAIYGIIAAATTTTAPTVLSGPADVQGSGVMLSCTTAGYRPSTAVGEASFAIDATLGEPKQAWSV